MLARAASLFAKEIAEVTFYYNKTADSEGPLAAGGERRQQAHASAAACTSAFQEGTCPGQQQIVWKSTPRGPLSFLFLFLSFPPKNSFGAEGVHAFRHDAFWVSYPPRLQTCADWCCPAGNCTLAIPKLSTILADLYRWDLNATGLVQPVNQMSTAALT